MIVRAFDGREVIGRRIELPMESCEIEIECDDGYHS